MEKRKSKENSKRNSGAPNFSDDIIAIFFFPNAGQLAKYKYWNVCLDLS